MLYTNHPVLFPFKTRPTLNLNSRFPKLQGIQYFIITGSSTLYAEVYAPSKREAEGYVVTMNYSPGGTLEIVIGQVRPG